jgi:hypothetical protein
LVLAELVEIEAAAEEIAEHDADGEFAEVG